MSKMQGGLLLILVKQFFFILLFIFKISNICLKFESKISYLWKELKRYLPSIVMKASYIMEL
jgi:hypothetical protein